jgi:hypothetical protein
VSATTSRERFDRLWRQIEAYAVVRIRAHLNESTETEAAQAELVDFLGPDDSDGDLNRAAFDLQEPVFFDDDQFGKLVLDRRVAWYEAETEWCDKTIRLSVTLSDSGAIEGALQVARALWRDQRQWAKRIEDYAVHELLPLKNENWLDDDEAELTADQFTSRMTLESVTVNPDGSFDFWHDDGDLFLGHAIQVSGSLSGGPSRADIPG